MDLPYTGKEEKKQKCPLCKEEMTFFQTDLKTHLGGYTCQDCDGKGLTHKRVVT